MFFRKCWTKATNRWLFIALCLLFMGKEKWLAALSISMVVGAGIVLLLQLSVASRPPRLPLRTVLAGFFRACFHEEFQWVFFGEFDASWISCFCQKYALLLIAHFSIWLIISQGVSSGGVSASISQHTVSIFTTHNSIFTVLRFGFSA